MDIHPETIISAELGLFYGNNYGDGDEYGFKNGNGSGEYLEECFMRDGGVDQTKDDSEVRFAYEDKLTSITTKCNLVVDTPTEAMLN